MKRFWEIDSLRGIAILCMIVFHSMYLLVFSGYASTDMAEGFWWLFPRCIAGTFLILVGVSLVISHSRAKTRLAGSRLALKFVLRGLGILAFGTAITAITLLMPALGGRAVFFGILHLIGVSVMFGFLFVRFTSLNLIIGSIAIALGLVLGPHRFPFYWLVWLGLRPLDYYPVDYLPMLPWAGFVFYGLFAGKILYRDGARSFALPELGRFAAFRFLSFLGRFSLVIYLAHIPLIYGFILLAKNIGL